MWFLFIYLRGWITLNRIYILTEKNAEEEDDDDDDHSNNGFENLPYIIKIKKKQNRF